MTDERDENQLLQDGDLPNNPFDDAMPMGEQDLDKAAPPISSFILPAFSVMMHRAKGLEGPVPLPWQRVAAKLNGGLWPGLYILVGNPKSGKSQWALQVGLHAAEEGIPVLYIGLELGETDLVARLLGLKTEKRWSRLWLGEDAQEIQEAREKCFHQFTDLPFHLEVAPSYGWNYESLPARVAAPLTKYSGLLHPAPGRPGRPPLVVLDFLQLVSGPVDEREDLRTRIQRAVYAGRAAARDHGAAVILVSSTAREHYRTLNNNPVLTKNGDKPGGWEDLGEGSPGRLMGLGKESGELEFAADGVLVLGQDINASPADGPNGPWYERHLAVAALRAGMTGWCKLRFNGGWFREFEHDVQEELEI